MIQTLIAWLIKNKNIAFKAICGLSVGLLIACSAMLYHNNKKLSQSLEMALNNIEMYLNAIAGATTENNTLKLTAAQLKQANDSLLLNIVSTAKENDIKISNISTAATQTLSINVSKSKEVLGVGGDTIIIVNQYNEPVELNDSILFNDQTKVFYTVDSDSVNVTLDIENTLYLYTFKHKEFKNKKKFLKRLFTLDFKKVWKYEYDIINTNDLIKTSDVRVVELTE